MSATPAQAALPMAPAPAPGPRRRVALWLNEMDSQYLQALRDAGVEVVALLQASHPEVPSFSMHDLFSGCPRLQEYGHVIAPAAWIDDASYRQYALCIQRMSFYPRSEAMETISGGIVAASDLEDWARLHLNNAVRLLHRVGAEEVWFGFRPHLGVDNMLALAAVRMGIKCLVFEQVRFAAKFTCMRLGEQPRQVTRHLPWKPWTSGAAEPNLFYMRENNTNPLVRGLGEKIRFVLRGMKQRSTADSAQRAYLAARKRRWWWLMYLLDISDPRTRPWAGLRLVSRRRFRKKRALRRRVHDLQGLGDFVYFPLHLEPEENVHVRGGRYRNQLDAVVDLHRRLPEGWSILLKENPKQSFMHRGQPFDVRLAELDRVRFVADELPSKTLIERARVVATITGTAGYEAMLAGKACLHFGDAWYAGLPGAVRFDDDVDLQALCACEVSRAELDAAVNALLSGLADGLVHPRYAALFKGQAVIPALYAEAARSMAAISSSVE